MQNFRSIALITGGARMGVTVGRRLVSLGFHLLFTYRHSKSAAQSAIQQIRAQSGTAEALRCDLARPGTLKRLARDIARRYGRLDALINLASIYEATPPGDAAEQSWNDHLNANARGAFLLSRALAPLLTKSPRGRIVHISDWTSASGRPRYPEYSAYYVSKAAVKAVVESLALEMAPNVLVNGIAPGPMLPPPGLSPAERRSVEKATPLRRWGGAEELAKAVAFLIETDFVTGETIRVDGGRHLL